MPFNEKQHSNLGQQCCVVLLEANYVQVNVEQDYILHCCVASFGLDILDIKCI